jgi:dTDP-4-amino-4,6-dideoxygalactose transaminase
MSTRLADRAVIPIACPTIQQADIDSVVKVLRSGQLAQGQVVADFEAAFASYIGARYAVATSSGTTALHLALLAHGIRPGDEVITTSFTFVATANAILYVGATPVFADIDPRTLNLSPDSVRGCLSPRTRAILAVHLYGAPCDLPSLRRIAAEQGISLIEDACQAHGAEFDGRRIGSAGTACFSFYPTKNMTAGEGGMITTSDPDVAERASLLRSHGMRIQYQHDVLGFNFRMTDIHAAIGLAQLSRLEANNAERARIAHYYDRALAGVRRPALYAGARSAWHQYTLLVDPARRDRMARRLRERGVATGVYYPRPVHWQPVYRQRHITAQCPVAEQAAAQVLSIPVHPGVDEAARTIVVSEVTDALDSE